MGYLRWGFDLLAKKVAVLGALVVNAVHYCYLRRGGEVVICWVSPMPNTAFRDRG